MNFNRAHWPGLDEREYRISQGHDAAAVLVVDGLLVAAAAEERFNLKKHTGDLPVGATHSNLFRSASSSRGNSEIRSSGFVTIPGRGRSVGSCCTGKSKRVFFQ
jgi:carbamoyltransferase